MTPARRRRPFRLNAPSPGFALLHGAPIVQSATGRDPVSKNKPSPHVAANFGRPRSNSSGMSASAPFGSSEQHFGLSKHERSGWLAKPGTVMTKPAILLSAALSDAVFGRAVAELRGARA